MSWERLQQKDKQNFNTKLHDVLHASNFTINILFSTQAAFLRVMKYNSHAVLLQCHWASAAHSAFYSVLSLMIWQQLDSHKGENESLKLWGDDIIRSPQARVLFN